MTYERGERPGRANAGAAMGNSAGAAMGNSAGALMGNSAGALMGNSAEALMGNSVGWRVGEGQEAGTFREAIGRALSSLTSGFGRGLLVGKLQSCTSVLSLTSF